jgi:hypothetical protein
MLLPSKVFDAAEVLELATVQRPNKILLASHAEVSALNAAISADAGKGSRLYDLSSVTSGAVMVGGGGKLGGVALKAL